MKRHYCTVSGCGKSFSRPSHLQRHALNHSTALWACSRCTASFNREDLLERHQARHAAKDKGAGGDGRGLLATKNKYLNRSMAQEQPSGLRFSEEAPVNGRRAHEDRADSSQDLSEQIRRQALVLQEDTMLSEDGSHTGSRSSMNELVAADFTPNATQTNPCDESNRPSSRDINVYPAHVPQGTELPKDIAWYREGSLPAGSTGSHRPRGSSHCAGPLHTTVLDGNRPAFAHCTTSHPPSGDNLFDRPIRESQDPSPTSPATPARSLSSSVSSIATTHSTIPPSPNIHTPTRAFRIPQQKQSEVVDLVAEIRPVLPDGRVIEPNLPGGLTPDNMQIYLFLFIENFNTSYPLVHLPSLDICNLDPIVLLSFIIMGATYSGKEAHQLSVCMYDAIIPYIFSGLLSSSVPDLAILQAFMVLECYGMYRAGPQQRENAMLIHSLLLNSIIRVSRYHVRACITLPSRLAYAEKDWLEFAYAEQYKRLIMFFFMWDTQNAACYSIMPNISTQSLQLGLPCSRQEWEAKREDEWKEAAATAIHGEGRGDENSCTFLGLVEVFLDSTYRELPRSYEMLDFSLALHGLVSICNDLIRFDRRSQDFTMLRTQQSIWSSGREQMAYALSSWKAKYEAYTMDAMREVTTKTLPSPSGASASTPGNDEDHDNNRSTSQFQCDNSGLYALYHTAHIVLNCEIRHLQIAAGAKALFGHTVTHADYAESCEWVRRWLRDSGDSASRAAWHAAQLFREGMLSAKIWDGNRIFHYPWCLYIATLTCWAYHRFGAEMEAARIPATSSTPSSTTATTSNRKICDSKTCPAQTETMRRRSRPSMHHLIATMASMTPAYMNTLMGQCCTHGLTIEMTKYLRSIRWTAAYEAMKVLEGLSRPGRGAEG